MQRLVDDLMSLSRIEMTEHLRPVEEWSLNQIAAESAAALLPVARQQGVASRSTSRRTGAQVLGDRDQLAQVFTNLIDNAMKYGGAGATVRVLAAPPSRAHPNRCGVTVEDTGPGIPREHIHRLTERFYRVSVASSRNKGGTGLGLAIVKHILNRHEGRLEIASTPGKGSAFTVWLPRRADVADAPRPPRQPAAAENSVPPEAFRRHENCRETVHKAVFRRCSGYDSAANGQRADGAGRAGRRHGAYRFGLRRGSGPGPGPDFRDGRALRGAARRRRWSRCRAATPRWRAR